MANTLADGLTLHRLPVGAVNSVEARPAVVREAIENGILPCNAGNNDGSPIGAKSHEFCVLSNRLAALLTLILVKVHRSSCNIDTVQTDTVWTQFAPQRQ